MVAIVVLEVLGDLVADLLVVVVLPVPGKIICIYFLALFCYTKKMEIKDVENLAKLARIELSESEKEKLLIDMESILGYVKQIESVIQTENIKPEYKLRNIWREDKMGQKDFSKESILEQFPEKEGNFLKVKKIL